jgi:Zn-dependent M32 family carboxypeptidase
VESNLAIPNSNPYFTEIAEDFYMQNLFAHSSLEQSEKGMRHFVNWQEKAIKERPTDHNFKMLIAGYQQLNNNVLACSEAEQAWAMYRENDEFDAFVKYCRE